MTGRCSTTRSCSTAATCRNSNAHDEFPLPTLLVGRGNGRIKGGQHLKYPDKTPLANLLLTVLERAGIPEKTLGNSSGVMSEV